jgi:hypothetical protein
VGYNAPYSGVSLLFYPVYGHLHPSHFICIKINLITMTLLLFLRAWVTAIFQASVVSGKKSIVGQEMSYDTENFFVPRIVCKDGWAISLQVHHGNYCSTENGYRKFGYSFDRVEWGFPTSHEPALMDSADGLGEDEDTTGTVGSIEVDKIQAILDTHGGIDWEVTLSVAACKGLVEGQP